MRCIRKLFCGLGLLALSLSLWAYVTSDVSADIYQWEYIDPENASLGKRPSAELAVDGAGVDAVPSAYLSGRDLSFAYLADDDLSSAKLVGSNLVLAYLARTDLTRADLSGAILSEAELLGATLTDASIVGADVGGTTSTGFTAEQLYSTASYKNKDLADVSFGGDNFSQANDLTAWDLSGQNVSGGSFARAILTDADFRQAVLIGTSFSNATLTGTRFDDADVRGANLTGTVARGFTLAQLYSTASYKNKDLTGISLNGGLSGIDLAGFNLNGTSFTSAALHNADFNGADLTGARLTGAVLTNASFAGASIERASFQRSATSATESGLTLGQLYSTASYQNRRLAGADLAGHNFSDGDFTDQDLSGATFGRNDRGIITGYGANLTGANFSRAKLTNTGFWAATLTDANFADADIRGAGLGATTSRGFTAAQLYSTVSYRTDDLSGVNLELNDLRGWNFSGKNLSNANLRAAELIGADFTGATIRGSNLSGVRGAPANQRGVTLEQLYSTASYQTGDLAGISLVSNNLDGADLRNKNLTGADFTDAVLTNVNFVGAEIRGGRFGSIYNDFRELTSSQLYTTASYQAGDLTGVQFISMDRMDVGWNLAGVDLTDADFSFSTIAPWETFNYPGVNFTNAIIRGAKFAYNGLGGQEITQAQLYSTASYQQGDLQGIRFQGGNDDSYVYDLLDWNFRGMNLDEAEFIYVDLRRVDFSHASLRNTQFVPGRFAWIFDLDFTGADLRGSTGIDNFNYFYAGVWTNAIELTGRIRGLHLGPGESLVVRDYDGDPDRASGAVAPIDVFVETSMAMDSSGLLRLIFDSDAWDSTIRFQSGIPVSLGGTLELMFSDDVIIATQRGRTIRVFDWTGVSPSGQFQVSSPYLWDLSRLYSTGEITLLAIPEPTTLGLALLMGSMVGMRRGHHAVR